MSILKREKMRKRTLKLRLKVTGGIIIGEVRNSGCWFWNKSVGTYQAFGWQWLLFTRTVYFYKPCHKSEYCSLDFISSMSFTVVNAVSMWQMLSCSKQPVPHIVLNNTLVGPQWFRNVNLLYQDSKLGLYHRRNIGQSPRGPQFFSSFIEV